MGDTLTFFVGNLFFVSFVILSCMAVAGFTVGMVFLVKHIRERFDR
ncbi:MAG: hypothetical protein PHW65_03585 [Dehalococcoidales bacterium]|nr:hypothetical protein [Dehalococcoidales bacterium]